MSEMKVSLVIRAIDAATAPIKAVTGSMNKVAEVAAKATRAATVTGASTTQAFGKATSATTAYSHQVERTTRVVERLGQTTERTASRTRQAMDRAKADWKGFQEGLDKVGNRAVLAGGAGLAGLGVHRAIGTSIKAEDQQAALANIADLSASAQQAMGQALRQEVKHTNRSILELTSGMGVLMGASWDDIKSLTAIRAIGRAATAEKASVEDLSRTVLAGVDNMKVPVEQTEKYLDVLAKAGKLGNFELKDMSQYLPSIGGMAQTLGIKGMQGTAQIAAALQVARGQTGKSDEAGTNTINFLMKLAAPETERNFANFGVNLGSELKKGRASGDLMGHMGSLIKNVTNGDELKMGRLFGDMQVKLFLNPFLENLDKYKQIQNQALKATGVVAKDFERIEKTTQFKMDRASNSVDDVVNYKLKPWLDRFNKMLDFFDRNPKLFDALITGLVLLVGGGLLAKGISGFMGLWGVISKISAWGSAGGFATLLAPLKGAFGGALALGWPLVAVLGAVAAGGYLIYRNWEPLKAIFNDVGRGAEMGNAHLSRSLDGLTSAMDRTTNSAGNLLSDLFTIPVATGAAASGTDQLANHMTSAQMAGWALAQVLKIIYSALAIIFGVVEGLIKIFTTLWDVASGVVGTITMAFTERDYTKSVGEYWSFLSNRIKDRWSGGTYWDDLKQIWSPSLPPMKLMASHGPGAQATANDGSAGSGIPGLAELLKVGTPEPSTRVEIKYEPKIEIRGSATPEDKASFAKLLEQHKHEIQRMVQEGIEKAARWNPPLMSSH